MLELKRDSRIESVLTQETGKGLFAKDGVQKFSLVLSLLCKTQNANFDRAASEEKAALFF